MYQIWHRFVCGAFPPFSTVYFSLHTRPEKDSPTLWPIYNLHFVTHSPSFQNDVILRHKFFNTALTS